MHGSLLVFIDGFDEVVSAEQRAVLLDTIERTREAFPRLYVVISSRPSAIAGWPSEYTFFQIQELNDDAVLRYVQTVSTQTPERREQFLESIRTHGNLRQLVHNPLMLTLLWQTFVVKGHLPTSRAFLYADISDFLLSTWDQTKGVNRTAKLNIAAVQRVLQRFARFQFEQQQYSLCRQQAAQLIQDALDISIPIGERATAQRSIGQWHSSDFWRKIRFLSCISPFLNFMPQELLLMICSFSSLLLTVHMDVKSYCSKWHGSRCWTFG